MAFDRFVSHFEICDFESYSGACQIGQHQDHFDSDVILYCKLKALL